MKTTKKWISLVLSYLVFLGSTAQAQSNTQGIISSGSEDAYYSRLSEYFYNKTGKEVLKPVQVIGGVQKPGLYHLPDNTSLTTLISVSGGMAQDADTKNIVIRHADGSVDTKDIYEIVSKNDNLGLRGGDMIYIPKNEGWFSSGASNNILIITSLLSLALTGYVVMRTSN